MSTCFLRTISHSLAAMVVIAGFGGALPAAAQQDGATEEIVVVGSRGEGRSALESSVPVDVISAEEIADVQAFGGELGELLQALAPSFNFPRQSNSGSADHVRAAQLRGMSPDHVLVLVNGKRQHTAAVVVLESKIGLGTNPFDFNTIPLSAVERIEILRDGAGAQYGSDAIAGVINVVLKSGEGGNVSTSYGAHRTDFEPVDGQLTDGHTWSVSADYGLGFGDGGSLNFGVEYRDRSPTNRAGIGVLPPFEEQTAANLALDPARVFAPGDGGAENIYLWYNATLPAGDNELYTFGRWSNRDSEGTGFFRYPDGFTSAPAVHPNGFRPITLGDNTDFSMSGGLRGDAFGNEWDVGLTVGRNDFESGVRNSANPSFGADSPTSFYLGSYTFTQTTLNADLLRTLEAAALEGPLEFAYGAELRFENYETGAGEPASYEAGPIVAGVGAQAGPGLSADSEVDVERFVVGLYADLSAQITERLAGGAAVRYEDYDDFGGALTGKLTGRFDFNRTFALRGALGTSYRAPSLAQTGFESNTLNFGAGGQLVLIRHLPVDHPDAIANGATPLEEEESANASLGLVITAGEAFNVTLDAFRVDVDDRVTLINAPDDITYFSNRVDTETTGFDVVASGGIDAGPGRFGWQVSYNRSETDVTNPSVLNVEDLNTIETAPPDDKLILSGDYELERFSALVRVTRFGETTRIFDFGGGFEPEQTYGAKWSLDVELGARITDAWSVALGADNLTDEYPDRSIPDIGYFGHLPYDVLSPIGMNGAYYYLRSSYDF